MRTLIDRPRVYADLMVNPKKSWPTSVRVHPSITLHSVRVMRPGWTVCLYVGADTRPLRRTVAKARAEARFRRRQAADIGIRLGHIKDFARCQFTGHDYHGQFCVRCGWFLP